MKRYSFLLLLFTAQLSFAQYCIPTGNCTDNDLINNFTFATISNLNSGGSNCSTNSYILTNFTASVNMGDAVSLSIQTTPNWDEGFGVWIDYNQNQSFDDPGEFVFSSAPTQALVNGLITIPTTATAGTTRLRVRCQYNTTFADGESCLDVGFGETEDYIIEIKQNNAPPVAQFSANSFSTCSGAISFTDESANVPTSWNWDFGDGNTSTAQNPNNTYLADGLYTVALTVTNAFGSNVLVQSNLINVSLGGNTPATISCFPATTNSSNGFGITNVTLNTINNSSGDGSNGYEDFTCLSTTLSAGKSYPMTVITDQPTAHNVRAWLDMNNDGVLSPVTELIFSADSSLSNTQLINIPSAVILNTPLRLRISADYVLMAIPTPCSDVSFGQAEDYTVIVIPNTTPPIANFNFDASQSCGGIVSFSDLSENVPSNWKWNFGDGTTSLDQNPIHTYTTSGTYSISLIATNNFGTDTFLMSNNITIDLQGQLTAASCLPTTSANCCGYGILNVNFLQIINPTGDGVESYQDYSCNQHTQVVEGLAFPIEIRTGANNPEDVKIWLDFNNDGILNNTNELVFTSLNQNTHSATISITSSNTVYNTPLRMRIISDFVGNTLTPCTNPQFGQVEDYAVTMVQNNLPPTIDITADNPQSCDGVVNFTDLSCCNTSSWLWNFGDGSTSSQQNPTHTYAAMGTYSISLTSTNQFGSSTKSFPNYITVLSQFGSPKPAPCILHNSGLDNLGIFQVKFGTINNITGGGLEGSIDFSCTNQTSVTAGTSEAITIFTSPDFGENVRVWIDFNDDGAFTFSEKVFTSDFTIQFHSGTVNIPSNAILNKTLRMRVGSDYDQNPDFGPCDEVLYGQFEDYGIIVLSPNAIPIPAFTSDSTLSCSGTIQFANLTVGNATSYLWDFGDATTSSNAAPVHIYSTFGTYTVKLTATNSNGSDFITKSNYINYQIDACKGLSISEISEKDIFDVYPIPNNGNFTIQLNNGASSTKELTIVNQLGQVVHQESLNSIGNQADINAAFLPSGIYFVMITNEKGTKSKKIIIDSNY